MSSLSSLTSWLRMFFDRLTASQSALVDKGSRFFGKAHRNKYGTVAEFKRLHLPMHVMALEERVTPAPFTPGNLVIYRAGNGTTTYGSSGTGGQAGNVSAAVFLD